MSELCQAGQPAAEPDSRLLGLVGAALQRFGPSIRLAYRTRSGSCVIAFPPPTEAQAPRSAQTNTLAAGAS